MEGHRVDQDGVVKSDILTLFERFPSSSKCYISILMHRCRIADYIQTSVVILHIMSTYESSKCSLKLILNGSEDGV